ncbi:MAG: hypothetical protein ACRDN0_26505 [Trebonia sp.]
MVGFSLKYHASVPEVIELAHPVMSALPACFVFAGGRQPGRAEGRTW